MEEFYQTLLSIDNPVIQILIAVGLGVFIGLRRATAPSKNNPADIMGVRTTTLLVLSGTIVTFFDHLPFVFPAVFTSILLFLLIAYINGVFRLGLYGLTSEITGVLLFLIGILIGESQITLAIILSVIIGISTAYKSYIHSFANTFSLVEWSGTLQLLVITALVLPFLPRTAIDPFDVFVPFNMWLLVVFISALGFVGYFCGKYLSEQASLFVTAFFGSLVSSTATTIALAQRSQKKRVAKSMLTVGLMISIAVMHLRVILEIVILRPGDLLIFIIVPLSMFIMAVFTMVYAAQSMRTQNIDTKLTLPENTRPFEFLPAVKFAAFFTLILYSIYFAEKFFGSLGVYISAFLTSLADVDAVVFSSLLTMQAEHITSQTALISIIIAVIVNTIVKLFYLFFFGSRTFLRRVFPSVLLIIITGIISSVFAISMVS